MVDVVVMHLFKSIPRKEEEEEEEDKTLFSLKGLFCILSVSWQNPQFNLNQHQEDKSLAQSLLRINCIIIAQFPI